MIDNYELVTKDKVMTYSCDKNKGIFRKEINRENLSHAENDQINSHIKTLNKLKRVSQENSDFLLSNSIQLPQDIFVSSKILTFDYQLTDYPTFAEIPVNFFKPDNGKVVQALISLLIESVYHLHENGFIHRALSPEHVLLFCLNDRKSVRLCGLGSICNDFPLRNDLPVIDVNWRGWRCKESRWNPLVWYSPEMLAQDFNGYGKASDMYSLGLIIYYMFTHDVPFIEEDSTSLFLEKLDVQNRTRLCDIMRCRGACLELLAIFDGCMDQNPKTRSEAKQLVNTCWIKEGLAIEI